MISLTFHAAADEYDDVSGGGGGGDMAMAMLVVYDLI